MKRIEVMVLLSFLFSIILSSSLIFIDEYDILKSNVIRIHILANSDSQIDQDLKYDIKDDIYLAVSKLLKGVKNKEMAKKIIINNLDYISRVSNDKIRQRGFNYKSRVSLGVSYFPTKKYDKFTLPAGSYDALKVCIGEGKGKNWWCVAFPPMCSPADENINEVVEILGKDQAEMISNPCEYKFALLEFIINLKQKIKR